MNTSPNKRVAPIRMADQLVGDLEEMTASDLEGLTLRQLLGLVLSSLGEAERKAFLLGSTGDKGNGAYDRAVNIGSIPIEMRVPRSRSGGFRPSLLPAKYQRGFAEEMEPLLLSLLLSSRSISSAKNALRRLGLPIPEKELDTVSSQLVEEMELRNTSPISPDMLAIFMDGKYVELRDNDRIRPATIYLVVGLGRDGKKRALACIAKPGRENLEDWKKILRSLAERGLRRVLVVVQDDFSGLLSLNKGLFPTADIQLCIVHMQRNAKSHLPKDDAAEFQKRIRTIKAAWNPEVAAKQFDDLCDRFAKTAPAFVAEIRKKRDHYLVFLKYPDGIRRSLSTTNTVEAVNGQLEKIRLNSGGYFQSEAVLKLKLGAAITTLEHTRWARPSTSICEALHQLNVMFQARFEAEDD
jgi:putative transposase